jgi:hypothetical protein
MTDEKLKKSSAEFNRLILSQLKPRIGAQTAKMLNELANDTKSKVEQASFLTNSSVEYSHKPISFVGKKSASMAGWVDEIFDCFQQFQFDFNKTVTRQDLLIRVERPSISQETVVTRSGERVSVPFFKGVMTTSEWAMVVRGQNELIEVFVIPIQALGTLNSNSNIARLIVMVPHIQDGEPSWRIDTDVVAWNAVRNLAKQLFSCLVKLAKGELDMVAGREAGSFLNKPTTSQPLSAADALAKLRMLSNKASAQIPETPPPVSAAAMDSGTAQTLQALLQRNREKHDIKKMTGRTKARFRQNFGSTLEQPNSDD